MSASDESSFWRLFSTKTVSVKLAAVDRDGVITDLVDLLVAASKIEADSRDSVIRALVAREELGSTGIGSGVAIPHVKIDDVSETVVAIGVAKTTIDFKAVDGEPCDVFFLMASPTAMADHHLAMLRWLSKLVRNPDFCRFMRAAKTAREAVSLLKEMSG